MRRSTEKGLAEIGLGAAALTAVFLAAGSIYNRVMDGIIGKEQLRAREAILAEAGETREGIVTLFGVGKAVRCEVGDDIQVAYKAALARAYESARKEFERQAGREVTKEEVLCSNGELLGQKSVRDKIVACARAFMKFLGFIEVNDDLELPVTSSAPVGVKMECTQPAPAPAELDMRPLYVPANCGDTVIRGLGWPYAL